ncbi:hypothetical protein KCP78_10315 [Salmonella enterica subsp. enterica]|nr:hypothetical protein KCP78_10315 [Salmonella enterica subsp. enterica]
MNNDEIILSLCARLKETPVSSMTQQQLTDRAHAGISVTIKRIEQRGGLTLDTLLSPRALSDKLHNLDAVLLLN